MNDETRSGADPLDGRNPLRTGNFNKIVLWVFVFIFAVMLLGIAVIKFGIGGARRKGVEGAKTSQVLVRSARVAA